MPENITRINLSSFLINEKDHFHIVRRTITSTAELAYHDHDYAEVFWIKEGSGIHIINGESIPVKKGHLCMIRPHDAHTFKVEGTNTGLVVTNIAFPLNNLNTFKNRYFPDSDTYFWTDAETPFSHELNTDQLIEISGITDYILSKPKDYMHLDLMILHIFKILDTPHTGSPVEMPYWLQYALENYQTPQLFKEGIAGFASLTGRSTDHVNRVIKEHLNQTLTETVTTIKINYAAQRLTMTNVPIKTICFDIGFNNIGHFYKIFKKYHGMTPKAFREINHKVF